MSGQSKTLPRIFLIGDDIFIGGVNIKGWVAMPQPTWEGVVTKRIVADTLSHRKGVKVALLVSKAYDDSVKSVMQQRDIADERTLKAQAYADRDDCLKVNGELTAKLKRRTPWATAAKVEVVLLAVAGGLIGYQQLRP